MLEFVLLPGCQYSSVIQFLTCSVYCPALAEYPQEEIAAELDPLCGRHTSQDSSQTGAGLAVQEI